MRQQERRHFIVCLIAGQLTLVLAILDAEHFQHEGQMLGRCAGTGALFEESRMSLAEILQVGMVCTHDFSNPFLGPLVVVLLHCEESLATFFQQLAYLVDRFDSVHRVVLVRVHDVLGVVGEFFQLFIVEELRVVSLLHFPREPWPRRKVNSQRIHGNVHVHDVVDVPVEDVDDVVDV